MALKDRTKQLYADTLIELMEKKSLQEIRFKDLCEKSGTDRHTFYYHFRIRKRKDPIRFVGKVQDYMYSYIDSIHKSLLFTVR